MRLPVCLTRSWHNSALSYYFYRRQWDKPARDNGVAPEGEQEEEPRDETRAKASSSPAPSHEAWDNVPMLLFSSLFSNLALTCSQFGTELEG